MKTHLKYENTFKIIKIFPKERKCIKTTTYSKSGKCFIIHKSIYNNIIPY